METGLERALAGLAAHRVTAFEDRVERWRQDLVDAAAQVYPDDDRLVEDLVCLAARAYAERSEDLHRLDERRLLRPDWLQQPGMVGYACYADRFGGDLAGVAGHVDHLAELGVGYLHLMPFLTPRPGPNDGGYAVMDFRSVRADLGTVEDVRALAASLRSRGISLVMDLVLNHVAREHEWAVAARAGDPVHRDYFWLFGDRTGPDAYEDTLPEVFPDFAPGSFSWDDEAQAWVWTTFNSWQWDLDWSNAQVLREFADLVLTWANVGVEVFRLDAIAFLWKRLGTTCQNQPEVHAVTQLLRTVARIAAPAVAFKAEAIVGPDDLVPYLGVGEHAGRVSDLAYHNTLMVQVWSALASHDATLAVQALAALPDKPASGTWLTYVRCHDDIGWAIDDRDAAAVGLSGFDHRRFLADWYAGEFPGSWARGLVFQSNEATGDRRTSGTTASLAGPQDRHGVERILLAHAVAAGWGGIPVVWSGDELAQPDDDAWAEVPEHAGDNRWAHRPALDWSRAAERHDTTTAAGRVFTGLVHLFRVRARLPQLHGSVTGRPLRDLPRGVLGFERHHPSGAFLALHNVTDRDQAVPYDRILGVGLVRPFDVLAGVPLPPHAAGDVVLPPYGTLWVVEQP
ncbi:alpha-amylase [Nocardioides mangrovicus]|uniref:Alpha-amylase n=1 Tax=Nocardioides mangrovicus TaxID=2478913 RepID=A0A3L8P763_9ACTN|nr:alpha-amylase family protein [Nocardioides mangrovicus]RLV50772.1 alpha-amylase [Nocardioides mangrovicus]